MLESDERMSKEEADKTTVIDAEPSGERLHHRELNKMIRKAVREGFNHIILENVKGQRFIGAGIKGNTTIEVYGDAGLDLGVFSEGLRIIVHGCSEYLLGNTLCGGELIVYGSSWDITGMAARGGSIYVMGDGGSRIGIHMKEYKDKKPTIVYGGAVKQYCGEYMAGGMIIVLGLDFSEAVIALKKPVSKENINPSKIKNIDNKSIVQSDLGAGIHGGAIYIRGEVADSDLGVYAVKRDFTDADKDKIKPHLEKFSELFNAPMDLILSKNFTKIEPYSSRPFGKAYTSKPV